jgi:hypothetical protein
VLFEINIRAYCGKNALLSSDTFSIVGTGGDPGSFLVMCAGADTFARLKVFKSATLDYRVNSIENGTMRHFGNIISLGDALIMGYDESTLEFEIYECVESGCLLMSSGSLLQDPLLVWHDQLLPWRSQVWVLCRIRQVF